MTVVDPDVGAPPPHSPHGGHVESPEARQVKEYLAIWIFIGSDIVFTALEIFTWFYLRALNTDGMWRGARCSAAQACTDGNGNPITHEIATVNPVYPAVVAVLIIGVAALSWRIERDGRAARPITVPVFAAVTGTLGAVAVVGLGFANLPFTTVDGAYASSYEYISAATLAHLMILAFVVIGMGNRARHSLYSGAHRHRLRLIKMFATWIAISTALLTIMITVFI